MSVYVQLSEEWGQTLKSFCSMYILISFWRASEMHLRKKYKEQWVVRIMENIDFSVGRDRIERKPGSWRKTKLFVRKSKWSWKMQERMYLQLNVQVHICKATLFCRHLYTYAHVHTQYLLSILSVLFAYAL